MAKPSWLVVNPATGSGNGNISNSSTAHTGRTARTGTVTVTASGLAEPKTYSVTQTPKDEFVSYDNGTEMAAAKTAGAITIKGKSNSSKLTFAFVGSAANVTLPGKYTANGVETSNNTAITGDPGASAEYAFSITLNLPANGTVSEVARTLKVTDAGGNTAQIVIKQAAGDPTLSLDKTAITIPQDGSAVSVAVTSNTSWTVS